MNTEQIGLRQACLLGKLLSGKSRKMTQAAIDKYFIGEKIQKHFPTDDPAQKTALDELVDRQILTRTVARGKATYAATEAADEYLKQLPHFPPLPPIDPKLKSFVLMSLMIAGDRWLLRKEIKALIKPTLTQTLGFQKEMVAPLMMSLAKARAVEEQDPGKSGKDDKVSYHLTAQGKKELVGAMQHPGAEFKMSGAALNELFRIAGAGSEAKIEETASPSADLAAHVEASLKTQGDDLGAEAIAPAPMAAPPSASAPLTDEALLDQARELLRERHGHTGLVPIFELRGRIKVQFGDNAASHEELDGRLRRLRRDRRLRLVSISDRSTATPEQLSESVAGEEEVFFYVGELQ